MAAARTAVVVVAVLAVAATGCLVQVTHVADAAGAFARARDEVVRDAARQVPVSHLNLLAWDPSERKMVRISVPLWLLRNADREIDWDDVDVGVGDREQWRRRMKKLRWEDIERAGPGILLEVTEDEGDRVLVWLR